MYKGTKIKLTDILYETMQAKSEKSDVFKVHRVKTFNLGIYTL